MLDLEIITPEKVLVKEQVDMVEAKGTNGEFGVLPGHTQFLTIIEIGEVRYIKDGTTNYLATSGGYAEVVDDRVTILLDDAELAEEIDVEKAKREMEEAEKALKVLAFDEIEYKLMEMALFKAIMKIEVASKRHL
ncbi:MAG: F0F1 ATP synthase subunit epsilon [Syntrophorhabdaceae bacterium]|jgi:F-type H+-transporting ATPase subunit epsilon|nr:F0F1 ATP synthase subunit epsilon [Syntrophorhabdaceae bacterium]MDD5244031.1 F0F1 ATP synthase subunit epsilon [Syntrophorhabdaceae bacterium]